jgi:hypothetical protein
LELHYNIIKNSNNLFLSIEKERYLINRILLIIPVMLFIAVSCKSFKTIGPEQKELDYTCIVIDKTGNISMAKAKLNLLVSELIVGYMNGLDFKYDKKGVTTWLDSTISLMDRRSKVNIEESGGALILTETGTYDYSKPVIKDYKKRFIASAGAEGGEFKLVFSDIMAKAIIKKTVIGNKGKILPRGDLKVKTGSDGKIFISESFEIFVF